MRAHIENQSKILPNAILDRIAQRLAFKTRFCQHPSIKMVPRGLSSTSLGALGRLLGRSWAAVGALLDALRALLGRFWDALGYSCDALGRSSDALGRSWHALGSIFESPGRFLRYFVASDGRFWSLQGSMLEPPGSDFVAPIFERGLSITTLACKAASLASIRPANSPSFNRGRRNARSALN